jgi:GNAT superfamily N-acetyltransferase
MEYEFRVVDQVWEKNMWNKLFIKKYDGKVRRYNPRVKKMLLSDSHKYVTIGSNGTAFGFVNLLNMSNQIVSRYDDEVWAIQSMLVKEEHRHQGFAGKLIEHVRDHHNVRVIEITMGRAEKLKEFHDALGFSLLERHPFYRDMAFVFFDPHPHLNTGVLHAENDNELALLKDMLGRNSEELQAA